jgi:hypothetical protein
MRTQACALEIVRSKINYPRMNPAEAAQALAEKVGIQEARYAVRKILVEVEDDVAEWDYWTDVRLWLLH